MNRLHRALIKRRAGTGNTAVDHTAWRGKPAGACIRRKAARSPSRSMAPDTRQVVADLDAGAIHGLLAQEAGPAVSWIFVDASLRDLDAWLAPLQGEVVHLDASRHGWEQIAGWLQGLVDVQTVHILSHGSAGQLTLGASVLDAHSLSHQHADALAVIAGALAPRAEIRFHGIDLAVDAAGAAFIDALASITGADVAASGQARAAAIDLPSSEVFVSTTPHTPVYGAVARAAVEGAPRSHCIGSVPLQGTLLVQRDGAWTYTPDLDFHGQDGFSIVVLDGRDIQDTVTVHVEVAPLVASPVSIDVQASGVNCDGGTLTITAVEGVAVQPGQAVAVNQGRVALGRDGSLAFLPRADFSGAASFGYTVEDAHCCRSEVEVRVAAGDPAPGNVLHMSRVVSESRLANGFRESMEAFPSVTGMACTLPLTCATREEARLRAALLSAFQSGRPGHVARFFEPMTAEAGVRVV